MLKYVLILQIFTKCLLCLTFREEINKTLHLTRTDPGYNSKCGQIDCSRNAFQICVKIQKDSGSKKHIMDMKQCEMDRLQCYGINLIVEIPMIYCYPRKRKPNDGKPKKKRVKLAFLPRAKREAYEPTSDEVNPKNHKRVKSKKPTLSRRGMFGDSMFKNPLLGQPMFGDAGNDTFQKLKKIAINVKVEHESHSYSSSGNNENPDNPGNDENPDNPGNDENPDNTEDPGNYDAEEIPPVTRPTKPTKPTKTTRPTTTRSTTTRTKTTTTRTTRSRPTKTTKPPTTRTTRSRPTKTTKPPTTRTTTTKQPTTSQQDTAPPDSAQPDDSQPDTAQPDTAQPDTAQPDITQPDTTQPDTTGPDNTQPDTGRPDTTLPEVHDFSEESKPSGSAGIDNENNQHESTDTDYKEEFTTRDPSKKKQNHGKKHGKNREKFWNKKEKYWDKKKKYSDKKKKYWDKKEKYWKKWKTEWTLRRSSSEQHLESISQTSREAKIKSKKHRPDVISLLLPVQENVYNVLTNLHTQKNPKAESINKHYTEKLVYPSLKIDLSKRNSARLFISNGENSTIAYKLQNKCAPDKSICQGINPKAPKLVMDFVRDEVSRPGRENDESKMHESSNPLEILGEKLRVVLINPWNRNSIKERKHGRGYSKKATVISKFLKSNFKDLKLSIQGMVFTPENSTIFINDEIVNDDDGDNYDNGNEDKRHVPVSPKKTPTKKDTKPYNNDLQLSVQGVVFTPKNSTIFINDEIVKDDDGDGDHYDDGGAGEIHAPVSKTPTKNDKKTNNQGKGGKNSDIYLSINNKIYTPRNSTIFQDNVLAKVLKSRLKSNVRRKSRRHNSIRIGNVLYTPENSTITVNGKVDKNEKQPQVGENNDTDEHKHVALRRKSRGHNSIQIGNVLYTPENSTITINGKAS